ncbi:P-loop containing nucleoside triphosphate hydrolase protein [Thermothelomyces heterothallicus CBS 202.75]|uniref:P-loop containing nucleoside triphosphate hydrolase protein n=1 Tax=Thermothelomyces heterothallicus CBS 202.75 TaxID=1149848 RepID=UPI00374206EE
MSQPARPPIPLQMEGGRAQPGSLMRRRETPSTREASTAAPSFTGITGASGHRNFEFTFDSAIRPGIVAAPTSPGTDGLWGRAYLVGQGQLHFEASPRMEDWLGKLQALSLGRREEEGAMRAIRQRGSATDEDTVHDAHENARAGDKRSAPLPADEDETGAPNQPARKRSRISAVLQRTFPRLGRPRAATTGAIITTSTGNGSSSGSRSSSGSSIPALLAAPSGTTPSAPLLSHLVDAGGTAAELSSSSPASATTAQQRVQVSRSRTVKVCLVGDSGAGKTALFNRLAGRPFVPTSTSLVPDFSFVTVRAHDGSAVNVELWDFPGIVAGARPGPLLSTFFHAAIICFSLESKDNLRNVADVWKPKLNACLHDQFIFVLGLKRDLRPAFPALDLSFLPTAEPATAEMGQQVAAEVDASAYGECSARTDDNVQGAWEGFINHVLVSLDERSRGSASGRRRKRGGTAVARFLDRYGVGRFGRERYQLM